MLKRRQALGLSHERLGAHANHTSAKTIARAERGLVKPHPSTEAAIAMALGCTVDQLYTEPTALELSRMKARISFERLAQHTRIKPERLAELEAGAEPTRDEAEQLAGALQTSTSALFPVIDGRGYGFDGPKQAQLV